MKQKKSSGKFSKEISQKLREHLKKEIVKMILTVMTKGGIIIPNKSGLRIQILVLQVIHLSLLLLLFLKPILLEREESRYK